MRGNGRVISGALVSAGVCSALAVAAASAGAGPAAATVVSGTGASDTGAGGTAQPVAAGRSAPDGQVTGKITRAGGNGTQPVIIFLRNQWAETGSRIRSDQRTALIQTAQAPYVGQLLALGATGVHGYRLVNAISARVPASSLGAITSSPGVASVIPDSPIAGPAPAMSPAGPVATAPSSKSLRRAP